MTMTTKERAKVLCESLGLDDSDTNIITTAMMAVEQDILENHMPEIPQIQERRKQKEDKSNQLLRGRIKEIALEIAPDYPDIEKVDSFERLWAIESSCKGTRLANEDWVAYVEFLYKIYNINKEEAIDKWKNRIENELIAKINGGK